MSVSYVARKCTQCAGKLEYIKDKKMWRCLYCGAQMEREEQYDGLFTIKNVVRQALLDISYRRLDSAYKNLLECQKIDSRYVGTIIVNISYEMITVMTPGACTDREAKALFAQLKKNVEILKEISDNITDEEEALYEFLEESDIYAMLVLVFDSLNDITRRDFLLNILDAKKIYSKKFEWHAINVCYKTQAYRHRGRYYFQRGSYRCRYGFGAIIKLLSG